LQQGYGEAKNKQQLYIILQAGHLQQKNTLSSIIHFLARKILAQYKIMGTVHTTCNVQEYFNQCVLPGQRAQSARENSKPHQQHISIPTEPKYRQKQT
jgi:hypothetical protein